MAISLEDFKTNYTPDQGSIEYLYSGSFIVAANISTTACDGENITDTLQSMTSVKFIIDGNLYSSTITSRFDRGNYYNYDIIPTQVSSTVNNPTCTVSLYASDDNSRFFTNSEYNAIIGNATSPETSDYIFNVDRKKNQRIPTNIDTILSGSAQRAEVQISNYTDTGLIRSRYEGTKTSIPDYGTVPIISGTPFRGGSYAQGTSTTLICNTLYNSTFAESPSGGQDVFYIQRTIDINETEEFLYDLNPKLKTFVENTIPEIRTEDVDGATFTIPDDEVVKLISISGDIDINKGDILQLENSGGTIEIVKVTSEVSKPTPGFNFTSFTILRGYRNNIIPDLYPINNGFTVTSTKKLLGDIIYKIDSGNSFYKLAESLVVVAETEKIYFVDTDGSLLIEVKNCGIPDE